MSIVNKIKESVEAATGLTCYYHNNGELNRIMDNAEFPCAFFTIITDAEIINDTAQLRERADVGVFFCDKTDYDFDSIENEAIISRMRTHAFRWLNSLSASDISVTGDMTSQRVYDTFDVTVTAYGVNVTVEEDFGVSKCDNLTNKNK